MNNENASKRYSFRRLDPFFTGVVQVIRTPAGQAFSHDGFDWQLEIFTSGPSDTWNAPAASDGRKIAVRFGRWNPVEGLQQVPANPILDLTQMLRDSKHLIGLLQEYAHQVPFPLADRFELWLLDEERRQPLALLTTSVRTPPRPAEETMVAWRASPEAGLEQGVPGRLERAIERLSGPELLRWFERDAQERLSQATTDAETSQQPHNPLPPLLLTGQWPDADTRQLVAAYHEELAPYLLTFQHLTDEQRAALELSAIKRPDRVAALWRLYPEIIHRREIDAARVEARLRSS